MRVQSIHRRAIGVALTLAAPMALAQAQRIVAAPSKPLPTPDVSPMLAIPAPSPDPRVGLAPGEYDAKTGVTKAAGEAIWNLDFPAHRAPTEHSQGFTHSDLAFSGHYVLQANYNGVEVWDVSNPANPTLKTFFGCPASQDDISVYGNLMFLSAESGTARLDCSDQRVTDVVSPDRIRGVRILDISDIEHPKMITQVQTCRGSHTHTLVTDPNDKNDVFIYVSGTSGIRPAAELKSCDANPLDPNTSLFNVEVIKVPLAHPEQAAVVSHPRIFAAGTALQGLVNPGSHGASPMDTAAGRGGRGGGRGNAAGRGGRGAGVAPDLSTEFVRAGPQGQPPFVTAIAPPDASAADSARTKKSADSLLAAGWTAVPLAGGPGAGRGGGRGGRGAGAPAPVDSLQIKGRAVMALIRPIDTLKKGDTARYEKTTDSLRAMGLAIPFLTAARGAIQQCHDITTYPSVGYAGGACAGMGLLLDVRDPANPKRLDAAADSNFSFWHSATFSNDGSKVLFSDEWGGGGQAYCRSGDPINWGGDALFDIVNGKMKFQGYYKMPAAQTAAENCVAHNGSLIPVPGRDIMVQAFYQGGLTVFDWTDPKHVKEIAFFDRGPLTVPANGGPSDAGFWSTYWYNGHIYGSEIARGFDVFDLKPSPFLSQNEIDAAKLIDLPWLNVQDQPKFVWPANIAVVRSYLDQLVRLKGMSDAQTSAIDKALTDAMTANGTARKTALTKAAAEMDKDATSAKDSARVKAMAQATRDLAAATK